MKETISDNQDYSWFDVGSKYAGKAVQPPSEEYYAMLISDGIKDKFELRVNCTAIGDILNGDPPHSVYKWLWYMSLVIAQDMEDTLPFQVLTVHSSDVKAGKLITPWRNLKTG